MIAIEALPPEVVLHILSYLDIPELDALARVSTTLAILAQDPVLHHTRLSVIAPSRVQHALFGAPRPTIADLVHWGVMRGLGLERRWRMGLYLHSPQSVKQFETSQRLQRARVERVLSTHIQHHRASQAAVMQSLHTARVLPDEEGSSPTVARSLLPIMRKLKWSIRRDALAQKVRAREGRDGEGYSNELELKGPAAALLLWLEGKGRGLWKEHERLRLAICPSIAKNIRYFEDLGK